jgi:hypothetical protein
MAKSPTTTSLRAEASEHKGGASIAKLVPNDY